MYCPLVSNLQPVRREAFNANSSRVLICFGQDYSLNSRSAVDLDLDAFLRNGGGINPIPSFALFFKQNACSSDSKHAV